jgi:hypothetical protein
METRLLSVWLSSWDSTFQEVTALDNGVKERFQEEVSGQYLVVDTIGPI